MRRFLKIFIPIVLILGLGILLFQNIITGTYHYFRMKSYIENTHGKEYSIIDKRIGESSDSGRLADYIVVEQDSINYRVYYEDGLITDTYADVIKGNAIKDEILASLDVDLSGRFINIQAEANQGDSGVVFKIYINDNLHYMDEEWLYDFYNEADSKLDNFMIFVSVNDPATTLPTFFASFNQFSQINNIQAFWAGFGGL